MRAMRTSFACYSIITGFITLKFYDLIMLKELEWFALYYRYHLFVYWRQIQSGTGCPPWSCRVYLLRARKEQINSDDVWTVCFFVKSFSGFFLKHTLYMLFCTLLNWIYFMVYLGVIWLYSSNFCEGNLMFLVIFKNYFELKYLSEVTTPQQTSNVKPPQRTWLTY